VLVVFVVFFVLFLFFGLLLLFFVCFVCFFFFLLLETLRQYALEQLDGRGETDAFRLAHARYFERVAARLGPRLLGPDEVAARVQVLADLDNLRAAVGWAVDTLDDSVCDIAVRIVAAIAREVVLNRNAGIGSWAERVIDSSRSSDPSWWTVMTAAAYGRFHRGELDTGAALAAEAVAATRETQTDTAVWAAMCVANITAARGDLGSTIAQFEEILTWLPAQSIYDARIIRSIMALYLKTAGDDDRSEALSSGALEQARAGGQPSALALALYAHGLTNVDRDLGAAERDLRESIALTEGGASDVVFANAYGALARVAERTGDLDAAVRLVTRAIDYADMVGDRPPMIDSLFTTARLLAASEAWEPFVTMAGAIKRGWWAPMSGVVREAEDVSPVMRARATAALGEAEAAAAGARGAAMNYDEIVAFTQRELRALA
jgi:hypothetical protein